MSDALTTPASEPSAAPPQLPADLDAATYTVPDVARLLQVSERHIWRMSDRKAIPGKIRLGRLVRFSKQMVDEWIASGCRPCRAGRGH
jgi:excisionase family DNA binding protein